MGFIYPGESGNVVYPGTLGIASSVAGTVTTIVTGSAHGLLTGDVVDVYNHTVCTAANSVNQIVTVVNATTFTIPVNSTGYSNGPAGGLVQPHSFINNRPTLPSDGDAFTSAVLAPGWQASLDQSAYSLTKFGFQRIAQNSSGLISTADPTFATAWGRPQQFGTALSLLPIALGSDMEGGPYTAYGSLINPTGTSTLVVYEGDWLEFELTGTYAYASAPGFTNQQQLYLALYYNYHVPGYSGSLTWTRLPGSGWTVGTTIVAGSPNQLCVTAGPVRLRALRQVQTFVLDGAGTNDSSGIIDVQLYAGAMHGDLTGDVPLGFYGDALFGYKIWRQNSPNMEV
jgi:hypothetical protein